MPSLYYKNHRTIKSPPKGGFSFGGLDGSPSYSMRWTQDDIVLSTLIYGKGSLLVDGYPAVPVHLPGGARGSKANTGTRYGGVRISASLDYERKLITISVLKVRETVWDVNTNDLRKVAVNVPHYQSCITYYSTFYPIQSIPSGETNSIK